MERYRIKAMLRNDSCDDCYWKGQTEVRDEDDEVVSLCTKEKKGGKLKLANKICSEYEPIRDKKLKKEYEKIETMNKILHNKTKEMEAEIKNMIGSWDEKSRY